MHILDLTPRALTGVCIYVIRLYNTGERSEPEKIDNNKVKTSVGPPPTHQASTQDPTSDKSQGGSGPPVPPLDPRLTKFVFFGPIRKLRWPPWPLIGRDIFDFSSETAERNSKKLDRKHDLNVLYQVCVFHADE